MSLANEGEGDGKGMVGDGRGLRRMERDYYGRDVGTGQI